MAGLPYLFNPIDDGFVEDEFERWGFPEGMFRGTRPLDLLQAGCFCDFASMQLNYHQIS